MDISIVIPTYNRKKMLERCVASLIGQDYPKEGFEIIVVDDGGRDGTRDAVKRMNFSNLRYIALKHNSGPSAARNAGIAIARADVVAVVDDDYILGKDWAAGIMKIMEDQHDQSVIQCRITAAKSDNPYIMAWSIQVESMLKRNCYVSLEKQGKTFINLLGGAFVFRKEIITKCGGFDENLRVGEDKDLFYRLNGMGVRILYAPEIAVDCFPVSDFFSFFRQQFHYGRGMIYFNEKWKVRNNNIWIEVAPLSEFSLTALCKEHGLKGAWIRCLFYFKKLIFSCGHKFEKLARSPRCEKSRDS